MSSRTVVDTRPPDTWNRCTAPRDGHEVGGPRCQETATHTTYLGRKCARHVEEMRRALRSPNTLVSLIRGRPYTEEEIAKMISPLPTGEMQ